MHRKIPVLQSLFNNVADLKAFRSATLLKET